MDILYFSIGLVLGIVIAGGVSLVLLRSRQKAHEAALTAQQEVAARDLQRVQELSAIQVKNAQDLLAAQKEQFQHDAETQKEQFEAQLKVSQETLRATIAKETAERVSQMKEEHEAQMRALKESNREQMEHVVGPLQKELDAFRQLVNTNKTEHDKSTTELKTAIEFMYSKDKERDKTTKALADALKNRGKVQGDWGEIVLANILRDSGLREGEEFFIQANVKDDAGHNFRPDVLVKVSDGTSVIIDSKVSLTAYTNYCGAEDEKEQQAAIKENYDSLWRHVEELAAKKYPTLVSETVPVSLMFVPNEGAYILAMNYNRDLGSNAFKKNVIIVNPTNLMMVLFLIRRTWQNTRQEKTNRAILDAATGIYEKYATFAEEYVKLGNQLNTARATYETGLGQLKDGRGNLSGRIENLRKLGATPAKAIEKSFAVSE